MKQLVLKFTAISIFCSIFSAIADRCSCDKVQCAPIDVKEPMQRAIILWNGYEQITFLSTDLIANSTIDALEFIPLPAEPSVKVGDLNIFRQMGQIASQNNINLNEMTKFSSIAPISYLGSIYSPDINDWNNQLTSFVQINNVINQLISSLVSSYQQKNYTWFAFDQIKLRPYLQTFPPIEYRFKASSLYYSLEISKLASGTTQVDLILITPSGLNQFSDVGIPLQKLGEFNLQPFDLANLSKDWANFMGNRPMKAQYVRLFGDIKTMKDLIANQI